MHRLLPVLALFCLAPTSGAHAGDIDLGSGVYWMRVLGAGDFDPSTPGDELMVVALDDDFKTSRLALVGGAASGTLTRRGAASSHGTYYFRGGDVADYDGDGDDDVLVFGEVAADVPYHLTGAVSPVDGQLVVHNFVGQLALSPRPTRVVGFGNLDSKFYLDAMIQLDSGGTRTWRGMPLQRAQTRTATSGRIETSTTTPGVEAKGFADVNGDGRDDLLLQYDHKGTRRWQIRSWNGSKWVISNWTSTTTPGVEAVGLADANNDGKADLWLQYDVGSTRHFQVRLSTGTSFSTSNMIRGTTTQMSTKVVGIADADGNGRPDLWLQHDSGGRRYWTVRKVSGSSFAASAPWTETKSAGVEVVAISDANGDGKSDLWVSWVRSAPASTGYEAWKRNYQVRLSNGSAMPTVIGGATFHLEHPGFADEQGTHVDTRDGWPESMAPSEI